MEIEKGVDGREGVMPYKIKSQGGTGEWAQWGANLYRHCEHNCRYCYQAASDLEHGRIKNRDEWTQMELVQKEFYATPRKLGGTIMFPTGHDILPQHIDTTIEYLSKWLCAGNNLLIVSKPHLECIKRICAEFESYKSQILFRFTIGSLSESICKFWEPNAPSPQERVECLKWAFTDGFKTSVSAEPLLGGVETALELYQKLCPYITDVIWFGKMNKIRQRVKDPIGVPTSIAMIEGFQSDDEILRLYTVFRYSPKVAWKDSIKKVVGI